LRLLLSNPTSDVKCQVINSPNQLETWKYEFAEPPSTPGISLREPETPRYVQPKVDYPNQEKVIYVKEKTYEVPGSAGGSYVMTRCEEMELGSGVGEAIGGKAEAGTVGEEPSAAPPVKGGEAPVSKKAGAVGDKRQEERNVRVARVEEWRVEVNDALQKADPADNEEGKEKKQGKSITRSQILVDLILINM
jgi:hypothetical protein